VEAVKLADAAGRFLAAPVIAAVASPPTDVSAMDGYAVREADLPSFRRIGASYPGAPFSGRMGPGECIRIFTGAPVPDGADRVIVQEIVETEGDEVRVVGEAGAGRHIRSGGSDFKVGDTLLLAGRRLGPRALVAAAGADVAEVECWRRPTVAVLGTGDELVDPGSARSTMGSIPESVSLGIAALVSEYGGDCIFRERVRDDRAALAEAAARALGSADLLVITGGASVGEKDYAKSVLGELGLELLFSKVSIKPGKPVWLGKTGGKPVIGLPGNPTSALVTGRLLLSPLVCGLAGGDPGGAVRWRRASLAAALPSCGDRETFVRGRWRADAVEPLSSQNSGAQGALAEAELLIRRRAGAPAAPAGEIVEIIDF
jgi:molybdopterin molybdotransferase